MWETFKQFGRKFSLLVTILIAIAAGQPLRAQNVDPDSPPPLLLTDEQEAYQLGPHMEILEDAGKRWTVEDIASPEFAHRFEPNGSGTLRIGFTDSAYWIRVQVQNDSQRTEWWLEHDRAKTQFVDLYISQPDKAGFERYQTGQLRPFDTRAIAMFPYVFPLSIPPQSRQVLYLRFEHSRAATLPLDLRSPAAFAQKSQFETGRLGTILGIFTFLFFSIFFGWYRLRQPWLLYLALLLGGLAFDPVVNQGIGHQYLWPALGPSLRSLDLLVAGLIFLTFVKTVTLALDTKQQYHRWHQALQGLMILCIVVLIQIPLFADLFVGRQMGYLYLLTFLTLIVLGLTHFKRSYRSPTSLKVGLLLFAFFLVGGILNLLAELAILPDRELFDHIGFLNLLIIIVLIAVLIADRLATAFKKQQEAQRRYEESALALQKANEELEQRVLDRTRELSVLYDVTSVASQALDLNTTMAQCLERVVEVMQGDVGTIHLVDEKGQRLRLATTQGLSSDTLAEFDGLPEGKGLTGQVLEQGEILIVPNVANDPRTLPVAGLNDLQSYVGIPVRASGSILGVLGIARRGGQPMFSVEEVALLGSIADQVGVVVESAKLREQAEQAAVIEERTRLARDLHDSVTQLMYSINLFAGVGQKAYRLGDVDRMNRSLVDLTETTQQAFKEMRLLVYELRPLALEQGDLVGALRHRLEIVEQRANIETDFQVDSGIALPDSIEKELYHIAEEALNNALKHGAATAVTVRLDAGVNRIELEISDNGRGFEPDTSTRNGGLGLITMRERAEKLGGRLTVLSAPGAGTTVKIAVNRESSNGR